MVPLIKLLRTLAVYIYHRNSRAVEVYGKTKYVLWLVDCIWNQPSSLYRWCFYIMLPPILTLGCANMLIHCGRVTHICVSNLTIIGSDNGLSPSRRQAIIWTNAGKILIRLLGTNFSEILIKILTFPFTKMRLKVSSAKRRPFCLGLNVLIFITVFLMRTLGG